jgi:NAD(P)-dependent dehydrogenase (short-subunit alcohol dehydrogenase family)
MDGQALKGAVEEVHARLGSLDVLVNNVGGLIGEVGRLGGFGETPRTALGAGSRT